MRGTEDDSASAVVELVLFSVVVAVVVARWWRVAPGGSLAVDPVAMVSRWLWGPVHPNDEARLPELRQKVRECRCPGPHELASADACAAIGLVWTDVGQTVGIEPPRGVLMTTRKPPPSLTLLNLQHFPTRVDGLLPRLGRSHELPC